MNDLDEDVINPLNINKYSLLKVEMNIANLSESEQFSLSIDLLHIIDDHYEQTVRTDIVESHVFDFDKENCSIAYILCDDFYKESFSYGLNKLNIKYSITDITKDFLNLKIDPQNEDATKEEEFNEFLEKLDGFKLAHLTIDKVLEKINSKGINSLSKLEKTYLDNHI